MGYVDAYWTLFSLLLGAPSLVLAIRQRASLRV
jgi:hypothetical protein